jgi:nitroreductase
MHVREAIQKRRSIRKYKEKEIEREKIELLKEAVKWAPSAGNLQARKFYFISDKKTKNKLKEAFSKEFIIKAPLLIICCGEKEKIIERFGEGKDKKYNLLDVAASIENLMLQAVELNLGTCWIGNMKTEKAKEILGLPENLNVVCAVTVGYPAEKGEKKERTKVIEEIK